ncbi:molybdenum cofactor guanylyltransferase [Angustibacter luteus]|uniref:Molybdenum cofactor guanylyltransferase n=1 Tax=Angustibacter luteus TaxID=658456 RepID=A0ABW1JEI6_9ACTN
MAAERRILDVVVVLAGGGSRRLGHDKLAARLDGVSVLDRLLAGVRGAAPDVPVLVVGARRATSVPVRWVREEPPGGGPVAGLARALDEVPDEAVLAVLAGDQPFAGAALPALLAAWPAQDDGVCAVDDGGRRQPLLALYRAGALRAAVGPSPVGRSMRSVLAGLALVEVAVPEPLLLDVDTEADLDRARRQVRAEPAPGPGT